MGSLPRGGTLAASQKDLLTQRIALAQKQGGLDEVILALSATTSGEVLGKLVTTALQHTAKRITRLGRGLPRGGEIEFADEDTLGYSLENRG
jgi:recombination protein RecR